MKLSAHRKERGKEREEEKGDLHSHGPQVLSCSVILHLTILVGVCRGLPTYPVDTDFPILLWDLE